LGLLIFVNPAKSPTVTPTVTTSSTTSDGHLEIDMPTASQVIFWPMVTIEGKVTGGGWFFEGSFPIKILDGDGTTLGQGTAQALDDWMSTGTVRFTASVNFDTVPRYATGSILFANDNPSGLPQNEKTFSLPVQFPGKGTVRGSVVLGPTCPVERIPPDPACAPKPYATKIDIYRVMNPSEALYETIATNQSGIFSVSLQRGLYLFVAHGGSPFPRCDQSGVDVLVDPGVTTSTTLNCDTGIR